VRITSKEEYVTMTFSLEDPQNPQNNISPISNQQIRGRGNSSWNSSWNWYTYTQSPRDTLYYNPYRIRFRNNQQQGLFGLPAARNWLLINADSEKNAFGFELGQRLNLQYTCTYHPVNFILNGTSQGNYILTEHRQADPSDIGAPGRPKIHQTDGWFIEIDRHYFNENNPEPLKFITTSYNLPTAIKRPSDFGDDINDPRYDFVKRDLNELADSMASDNFPENGYRDMIDAETFIKYFIVQTVIQNVDLFRSGAETGREIGSTFFYKGEDGKISAGPLWDLNWSFQTFNTLTGRMGPNLHPYQVHPWFRRFFDDPLFLVRYKEIWNEYLPQISSMRQFIDDICDGVRGAGSTWPRNEMITFFNARMRFLTDEYNKVNVRPLVKNFGTTGYNYTEAPARTVTLVSYGEMTDLTARLQRGPLSDFGIVSEFVQTAGGSGGYLATVNVKPKDSLAIASYHDTLILSGVKQGSAFSFRVPLEFTVADYVSVLSYNRTVPPPKKLNDDAASAALQRLLTTRFTAGPNPVRKSDGIVKLYASGKSLASATVTIYDPAGNAIRRISISDRSGNNSYERRVIGEWDLKDSRGRTVTQNTYLIKGTIPAARGGGQEKMSLMIGVW